MLFTFLVAASASFIMSLAFLRGMLSLESGMVLGISSSLPPVKYAVERSIAAGIPETTIVLLLLLPFVASVIAATRQIVGLRGFGIFLPATLSIVFVAIGPIVGIALFLLIVLISTFVRMTMRFLKLRLQYLPRMAVILWFVVAGVLATLFAAPYLAYSQLISISIFPILIMTLLAEDFTRVQLGKSARTAITITTETLVLALISFFFLTLRPLQEFALENPEILLLGVLIFDVLLGRYVGLRFLEFWRFRKLISG